MSLDPRRHQNADQNGHAARALDRACDAALFGEVPSSDEWLEARDAGVQMAEEVESLELVAARLDVECFSPKSASSRGGEEMPTALRAKLRALADAAHVPQPIPIDRERRAAGSPSGRRRNTNVRDWFIAAACIAFGAVSTFFFVRAGNTSRSETPTDPARFVSMYPTSVRWPWTPAGKDHVTGEVRGEAIFDPVTSHGLLVIEGLAVNDPSTEQYQLWIFDAKRDERFPVDGGVFNMPACGKAAIPISAKLRVDQPMLFAVTIEKPGGVVVSDRRIAIVAKP